MLGGCFKLGCLGISLLSILPFALIAAVTIAVGSLFTTLPAPFAGIGEGIRGAVGQAALSSALPDGVDLESITRDGTGLTVVFIAPEPTKATERGTLVAGLTLSVAGYVAAPFDPAPGVKEVTLRVVPESGAKSWARLTLSVKDLRAYLDGLLDWAALTGSAD